jgi:hypothetical protein
VCRRGKADNDEGGMPPAKCGNRTPPVILFAKASDSLPRNLLTPLDKALAPPAFDDRLLQLLKLFRFLYQRLSSSRLT